MLIRAIIGTLNHDIVMVCATVASSKEDEPTSMRAWSIHQVHNHMHPQDNGRQEEWPEERPEAPLQINQHHILLVAWHCRQQDNSAAQWQLQTAGVAPAVIQIGRASE